MGARLRSGWGSRRATPAIALLLAPAAALALAGCDPADHPFADTHSPPDAAILQVKDSAGIVVAPVAGVDAPTGAALAEAVASALRDLEIPASTGAGNRHSQHLSGTAAAPAIAGGNVTIAIHWSVRGGDGGETGSDDQTLTVPNAVWTAGTPDGFAASAAAEAKKLGPLLVEAAPAEHKPGTSLTVKPITGAPGDGGRALPSALTYLLKHRGLPVTEGQKDTVSVVGEVQVTAGPPGHDHVRIVWHVLKPDGTDVGQIGQENDIPHGALDGHWGQTAMAVALAGIDDIVRLVALAGGPVP
jgi:hypothetical protein